MFFLVCLTQAAKSDPKKLNSIVDEVLSTERSYFSRIRALKRASLCLASFQQARSDPPLSQSYADPLRKFSRDPATTIISTYNVKLLFGNIDSLVNANEAFLADLEKSSAGVPSEDGYVLSIGDVALKHVSRPEPCLPPASIV